MNSNVSFILGLYAGLLDRMPDPTGLKYWVDALDSGSMTREHVVTSFFNSPEFQARSNSGSLHEIVSDFYSNAFNRPADPEGLAWWTAQIDAGVPMDQIIIGLLSVIDDPKNADGQRLQNMIDATLSASTIYQKAGVDNYWVATELDGITSDPNSVAMFNYQVQQSVGVNAPAPAVVFDNWINGNEFPLNLNTDINGTNLNDYIILGRNTQFVYGKDGDDQFIGAQTNITFYPGAGNDTVEAGGGTDTIDARNDAVASRRDAFYGQDGNDTVYGGASDEFIDGGDGDDLIDTGAGKDVVRGGIGNDTIIKSGAGDFNFLGEAGDDTIIIDAISRGQILGDAGNDTIILNKATGWQLWAGSGNDVVTAKSGNYSYAYMGEGNDKISLTGLHDITIYLGDGDDTVELNNCQNVKVYGGYGKDAFHVTNSSNLLLVGENDQDSFFVDAVSLKTGTVNMRGWKEERTYIKTDADGTKYYDRAEYTTDNYLLIEGLTHGDNITFNDENFRDLSEMKLDHSQAAKITFDNVVGLGKWKYVGGPDWASGFRIADINGIGYSKIQNEVVFKYAVPFNKEINTSNFMPSEMGEWGIANHLRFANYADNIREIESKNVKYLFAADLLDSSIYKLVNVTKVIDGDMHLFRWDL